MSFHEASSPLGIQRRRTPPGLVQLLPHPHHRVRVHAGAPVRGTCGETRFVYERGDIDILPTGYEDTWQEKDAGDSILIEMPPALLRRAAEECGVNAVPGLDLRCQIQDRQLELLAFALDAHRAEGSPGGHLYEECLGLALAVRLVGGYRVPGRTPRGLSAAQLRTLKEYIEANLDRTLSLGALASVAGLSASHLKVLFKRSTGMPVHAFVVRRRVERARDLLRQGELAASEVALAAGFSHQSHMARCMRRVLGITPGAVSRSAEPRPLE